METLETNELNLSIPKELDPVYRHPTMDEFYGNLTPFIILAMFVSSVLFILNMIIYFTTFTQLRRRLVNNRTIIGHISIALCTPYPLISLAALLTVLIPKAWLACHTIMHLSFTICGVLFHRLCIKYMDSESNFIKLTDNGNAIAINTPPCCCCCLCLPNLRASKVKFGILKYLIWQMPFVQGSVMLVLNFIYYTNQDFYNEVQLYFMPFIVCSILMGLWGLNILVRLVIKIHEDYGMMKKLFCLQLILLLCKLQYLVMDRQLDIITLGGVYPMNHTVYKQTFINILILAEMILVSLLAQNAYKIPVDNVQK